jgi:hypothetical protein
VPRDTKRKQQRLPASKGPKPALSTQFPLIHGHTWTRLLSFTPHKFSNQAPLPEPTFRSCIRAHPQYESCRSSNLLRAAREVRQRLINGYPSRQKVIRHALRLKAEQLTPNRQRSLRGISRPSIRYQNGARSARVSIFELYSPPLARGEGRSLRAFRGATLWI